MIVILAEKGTRRGPSSLAVGRIRGSLSRRRVRYERGVGVGVKPSNADPQDSIDHSVYIG